jgi:uncharacterized protein (TIGR02453 family)
MPASSPFPPAFFRFLRELRENNDRAWFTRNRERYELDVKDPALTFVRAFAAPLRRISPHFVADPRPVGGSMFRIHRDTRFARDKSPYKTHVGLHFRHERGKDVHSPGFYLHLEPGEVFAGAGIWHPDTRTQRAIRRAIVEDPGGWKRATRGKKFAATHRLAGDSLKRPPRDFDPEHPLVEDLKRKDFLAVRDLARKDAAAVDFADRVAESFRTAGPLVRFLCRALDLPY